MMQHTEIIGEFDEFGLGVSKNWLLYKDYCIDDYIAFFNILFTLFIVRDSPKDQVKHLIRISSAITNALVSREIIKGAI